LRHPRSYSLGLSASVIAVLTLATAAGPAQSATSPLVGRATPKSTSLTAEPAIVTVVALPPAVALYMNLSAVLTSAGQPLAGQTVTFSIGSSPVCSAVTDATGTARCADPGDTVSPAILSNGYEATYAGGSTYSASSSAGPLVDLNLSNLLGLRL
jgi:hypothetical protein